MGLIIIGIVIVGILFISIFTIRWTVMDYGKQKEFMEGLEYRRVYGIFDPIVYKNSQKAKKDLSFLRQSNTGLNPKTFNKSIQCINYCDDKSRLVIKRR